MLLAGPFGRPNNAHSHNIIRRARPLLSQPWTPWTPHSRSFSCSPPLGGLESLPTPRPSPNPRAKDVAVLGGGITGLTTAYYISLFVPHANITIYDKSHTLGGWMSSEKLAVKDGHVVFEWGPRTLRPDLRGSGWATACLKIASLDLGNDIVVTPKTSPAATNRYIYYPDHLVRMPGPVTGPGSFLGNIFTLLTEPIFQGAVGSVLAEPFVQDRSNTLRDESVGHFLERRFGKTITHNLASAFFHGIYAGDLYKLSVETLLPRLWAIEGLGSTDSMGVLLRMVDMVLKGQKFINVDDTAFRDFDPSLHLAESLNAYEVATVMAQIQNVSVYTFANGLGSLASRLGQLLGQNPKVTIRSGCPIESAVFDKGSKNITLRGGDDHNTSSTHDYVVSTLGPSSLHKFLELSATSRQASLPPNITASCKHVNRSVTVMVVNLYYSEPDIVPPSYAGFGYLIPSSVPTDQNPERALGVIFGSESSGQRGPTSVVKVEMLRSDIRNAITSLEHNLSELEHGKVKSSEGEIPDPSQTPAPQPPSSPVSNSKDNNAQQQAARKHHIWTIKDKVAKLKARESKLFPNDNSWEKTEVDLVLGQDSAPGTKLTVMIGGHWWDGWRETDYPSESEAIEMAKSLLARHLKIAAEPEVAKARLARNCIPQYPVGYRGDMANIHSGLMSEYQGRFKVAGPWWQGAVGVNDCIRKAKETAWAVREQWDDKSGLERYQELQRWAIIDPSDPDPNE